MTTAVKHMAKMTFMTSKVHEKEEHNKILQVPACERIMKP